MILTVLLFRNYFYHLILVFFFAVAFPPLETSGHFAALVSINVPSNSKGDAAFHLVALLRVRNITELKLRNFYVKYVMMLHNVKLPFNV